jgi:hypothetical protein
MKIEWGSQIRNYDAAPLVKSTGYETSNVDVWW